MAEKTTDLETHKPESVEPDNARLPEVVLDKIKKEITFTDETGKQVAIKARIIEEEPDDDDEEALPPMEPDEFESALRAIDKLGLTWTADPAPRIKPKTAEGEDALLSEEFERIQDEYPRLPFEVFLAASQHLTGSSPFAAQAGGKDSLERKAAIAGQIIVDSDFRNEFFFKSAIKVPYLRDIDWEIVSKVYERGVKGSPGISYGLLALSLQDPFNAPGRGNVRHITVAVDEVLIDNLLSILTEVRSYLASARHQTDILSKQQLLEEQDDREKA